MKVGLEAAEAMSVFSRDLKIKVRQEQYDGFMRLMQERREGTVCGFESWWRVHEVYQSFVRLLLFGGGFTIVRECSAVGCVHNVYRERFSALSTQETLRLEGITFREEFREALQYCAKVMQTNFDEFSGFSGLFGRKFGNISPHCRDTYCFNPANFRTKVRCVWYFAANFRAIIRSSR